jgi:hypothetical protein
MTKRQQQARIREVSAEVLDRIKKRFPAVELLSIERLPTGMVVLHVYAPHEDAGDVIEAALDRMVEAIADDGLCLAVMPTRNKPARRAA